MNNARRLLLSFAAASAFSIHASAAAIEPPTPVIESITPAVITAGGPQTVTITGHDFLNGAAVQALLITDFDRTDFAQAVTVVSATTITFTVQCQPTATNVLDILITNPNGHHSGYAPAALTLQPQLSDLTPIIFDETVDYPDAGPRGVTTVIRARVAPRSSAYLVFDGTVRVPYAPYNWSGVATASDDDGDGVVTFHPLPSAPGNALYVVVDSTGAIHKGTAPFQQTLPDSTWFPSPPHVERSPDGTMSRYDLETSPDALFLWVRPGAGAWYVSVYDHNAVTDSDGVPLWDGRAVVRAAVFSPFPGVSSPPPAEFAPSDVVTVMTQYTWSIERLPSPLAGTPGGTIRIFADGAKEGTPAPIYLRRIRGSEGTVSVNYHTVDGTAVAGKDYVAAAGTISFAPGEYVKTLSIPTIDDGFFGNGSRTFSLATSADGGSVETPLRTMSIFDAQNAPVISIADVRVDEGDSASATAQVPVTLAGKTSLPASFTWQTIDDHQNASPLHLLTFAPGETQKMIPIDYAGDTTPGADRRITIYLDLPSNATLPKRTATLTIADDDTPRLSVNDLRSDERTATASFLVTMSRVAAAPVSVHYQTIDGTATSPLDYTATTGVRTFAPGEVFKTVSVPVVFDDVIESDETFSLKLSQPTGAIILRDAGVATIIDSDPQPSPVVLVDDLAVPEGNSGTTDATFNVHLSFASAFSVTVAWQTQNGSAHDDSDYAAAAGTLIFAPGETDKNVTVKITGDTAAEPNKLFRLVITAASRALPGPGGACTIVNDDGQPPPSRRRPSH